MKNFTLFEKAENRDTFFGRVHTFVLPYHAGAVLIAKAYQTAKDAHRGIKRKRGERYFEHCRAVALLLVDYCGVRDAEVVAAALLHDIVEDVPGWTVERIAREFTPHVAQLVGALSMPTGEFASRDERLHVYHAQVLGAGIDALTIKLCDRLHNLSTSDSLAPDARLRMVEETEAVYLSLAKEQGTLYHELCAVIAAIKEEEREEQKIRDVRLGGATKTEAGGAYADGKWHSHYPDAHGWHWSSHE